jgi:hypothetical protein
MRHSIITAFLALACVPVLAQTKCTKYQHFVAAHQENCDTNMIGCSRSVPDQCVDDVHWLTEAEYQDLLARVKAVEDAQPKPLDITWPMLLHSRPADWSMRGSSTHKDHWTGTCDFGWRFSDGREVHRFKPKNDADDEFNMSSDLCFKLKLRSSQ